MIVLKGAGSSNMQLAVPAIIVAAIFAIICYAISLHFLPQSYREFKETQSYIRNNYSSLLLQEGVFNTPTKGLTVYVDKKQDDGKLKGILVYDSRDKNNPTTMMAQEGKIVISNESSRFELSDGNRQEINKNNKQLSLLYFKEYVMDFSSYTNDDVKRVHEAEERFIGELISPKDTNISAKFRNKLMAEAHQRLTWPFFNIVLSLIALSALLSGQLNRRGQWKRITVASSVSFVAIISNFGLNNLISSHPNLAPVMYINIAVLIIICLMVINQYNFNHIKKIFGRS
jgi:lipopolysaccharide export system permease protein